MQPLEYLDRRYWFLRLVFVYASDYITLCPALEQQSFSVMDAS